MKVYLDSNTTTMLDPSVYELMLPFLKDMYGNPNSLHQWGGATHPALREATDRLYVGLGADDLDDIVITSCATESINWVLKGIYFDHILDRERNEVTTSSVEHPAVATAAYFLKSLGIKVMELPVNEEGVSTIEDLRKAISGKTALVSVAWANNETGMIFDVQRMAETTHEFGALFHTDATRAVGEVKINLNQVGVDFASFLAHKFHGPEGVGGLFIKKNLKLTPPLHGREHMGGRRSGTLNVPYIVAMGEVLRIVNTILDFEDSHIRRLRGKLEDQALALPDTTVVGKREHRMPNTILASIKGAKSGAMLWGLNEDGITASTGSACASEALESSPIVGAIEAGSDLIHTALKLSLSHFNTEEEIDCAAKQIKNATQRLKTISCTYVYNPNNYK